MSALPEKLNVQEEWWRGSWGDAYLQRNHPDWMKRRAFWELMLERTRARSVLEVGCNRGANLIALRDVDPTLKLRGVDVNASALAEATALAFDAREVAARDVGRLWPGRFDVVVTVGCLIHVAPADLHDAMRSIIGASNRFVLAVEYGSEIEEEISYRGHADRLWKRPFGAIYVAHGLSVVDSGQLMPGDGFDNTTWWLMSK